jgi:hypothetical protein
MQVTVRAALRFKHRAGLEKGVTAFDDHAYPEFFKSELWDLVGPFALCERTFEIEPDCDPTRAFMAMAMEAVEGSIDLRASNRKREYIRFAKLPKARQWIKLPMTTSYSQFAAAADDCKATWAEQLAKAKRDEVARTKLESVKAKKAASKSTVVTLKNNPTRVVVLADGSLAAAAGTKVVFVDGSGTIAGETECQHEDYDMFNLGITGLTALPDGRVLAFQELAHEMRITPRGMQLAERFNLGDDRTETIKSGTPFGDSFALQASYSVALPAPMAEVNPLPSKDDAVYGVLGWQSGVLAWGSNQTAWLDPAGKLQWTVAGERPLPYGDQLIVKRGYSAVIVDRDGRDVREMEVGSIGHGSDDGYPLSWAIHDDTLFVATCWRSAASAWNLATGERLWRIGDTHTAPPGGIVVTPKLAATWAPPPFIRDKDQRIAVFVDGKLAHHLDAKAPVLGVVALGDDTLAAWVDGRTAGTKILVWRNAATRPKLETLPGHTGRVRGLIPLADGRLLSWAADKSLRIWSI